MSQPPGDPETDPHASGRLNRLAGESSPYLLLHQRNPVDWYPWGREALEKAREEDKPIFLSVGYSTCYWCHVMERESFSDPVIAELLNRHFVAIKVDREERPDLDEVYMTATQILTRQGGWPNSVFLTPDLKPFYAGTYFPPEDRYGRPGFATVVQQLAAAWEQRRVEVIQQSEELAGAMQRALESRVQPAAEPAGAQSVQAAREALERRFDARWGGFGGAPKFPTPSNLFLLQELAVAGDGEAGRMLTKTLDEMARGGIYDQLGGGFHRYATDREWRIPHFEKMLYDNGLLLSLYGREHARTGDPEAARIVRETAAWVEREMTSERGGFLSAIDAETDAREGAFYVWTREQLEAVLDEDELALAAPALGFAGEPFFEEHDYVLHLPAPLAELAAERELSADELLIRLAGPKGKLLAARDGRERPLTDDKILTDWNGMMIAGLADAGRHLGDDELVSRAARAARFVLDELWVTRGEHRVLMHTWRSGEARVEAFLADYAFLVRGLLALHTATGEERWLSAAVDLTREQIARLRAPQGGFFVAEQSADLLFRSQDPFDGAVPSANAVAALNLLALSRATGEERWQSEAEAVLRAFASLVESYPDGVRMMALATLQYRTRVSGGTAAPDAPPEAAVATTGLRHLHREAEAAVEVSAAVEPPGDDGWRPVRVRLVVADGWHVNANPASQELLIPTAVAAAGESELKALTYPPAETFRSRFSEQELAVYSGEIEIPGELRGDGELVLEVTYQACDDDRCLPPVTRRITAQPAG